MDLNSSLDSIIQRKGRSKFHGIPPPRHRLATRHSSSSRPYSTRPDTRRDRRDYESDTTITDLRGRIGIRQSRTGDRHHPQLEKNDLRGRIGKRVNPSVGLSTSNLPNRQQRYTKGSSSDGDDTNRRDSHSIVITKPVYQQHSNTLSPRAKEVVDPASIVITKKINKTNNNDNSPSTHMEPLRQEPQQQQASPEQTRHHFDTERSFQHYLQQQQQEQQLRQQVNQQLQQQLLNQSDQIMALQRQLNQRSELTSQQPMLPPQSMAQLGTDTGRNFSFRPMVNDGLPPVMAPPVNLSTTVILSNLDPAATANDVQMSCTMFGPVIRCDLIRDRLGRSCGEAEVEFLERTSALDCVAKFDNEYVDDRIIRATLRQPPAPPTVRSVIAPTRSGYRTTSQVLYTNNKS